MTQNKSNQTKQANVTSFDKVKRLQLAEGWGSPSKQTEPQSEEISYGQNQTYD